MRERNDRPVFAHELITRGDESGRVEYLKHLRNARRGNGLPGVVSRLLLRVDPVVHVGRDTETFRRQHDEPSACKVLNQPFRCAVW